MPLVLFCFVLSPNSSTPPQIKDPTHPPIHTPLYYVLVTSAAPGPDTDPGMAFCCIDGGRLKISHDEIIAEQIRMNVKNVCSLGKMCKSGSFPHAVELQKHGAEDCISVLLLPTIICVCGNFTVPAVAPSGQKMLMCFLHWWPWIVLLLTVCPCAEVTSWCSPGPLITVVSIVDMIFYGVFGKRMWFSWAPSWQTHQPEYTQCWCITCTEGIL